MENIKFNIEEAQIWSR